MSRSRSVFTAHERDVAKAAWSSTSARLSRDSFLPFGSCFLCLEIARDPVSCSHGDIFCRECAFSNLLAQKKEIKRLERAREHAEHDIVEAQARQDADAQDRAVKEFERTQAGLSSSSMRRTAPNSTIPDDNDEEKSMAKQGNKRKFVLDGDELDRIAKEDRSKARKAIDQEKSSKAILPSFWTPSQTPNADAARKESEARKKNRISPVCPASPDDQPHLLALKTLVSVKFTDEQDSQSNTKTRICPACMKTLGNASRPMLASNCGHVFCRSCVVKFIAPAGQKGASIQDTACYVCETKLTPGGREAGQGAQQMRFPGLIELRCEGTGFSAGGASKVEKSGVAFQC